MPKSSEPKTLTEAIERLVEDLKPELEEMLGKASSQMKDSAQSLEKKAKEQIEEKPMMTLGITALLFLVVGFLLGRGSKK